MYKDIILYAYCVNLPVDLSYVLVFFLQCLLLSKLLVAPHKSRCVTERCVMWLMTCGFFAQQRNCCKLLWFCIANILDLWIQRSKNHVFQEQRFIKELLLFYHYMVKKWYGWRILKLHYIMILNIFTCCFPVYGFPMNHCEAPQITKFMGPTWGPPGSCRPQMGPMLAPWTLLSGSVRDLVSMGMSSHNNKNNHMQIKVTISHRVLVCLDYFHNQTLR